MKTEKSDLREYDIQFYIMCKYNQRNISSKNKKSKKPNSNQPKIWQNQIIGAINLANLTNLHTKKKWGYSLSRLDPMFSVQ